MPKSKTKPKRLDGKQKLLVFTSQMTNDIRAYCRDKGIESESELIRQAVAYYLEREYEEKTLELSALKDVRNNIHQLKDMMSVLFSYIDLMHFNILAYHPELDEQVKEAATSSAKFRLDKFFTLFQRRLRDDPPLFEKLLHKYVSGALDG